VLKKVLSATLAEQATKELPQIIARLDAKIIEARNNESFLQRLASEPDMRTVAKELEGLVNQLHPAADSRMDYEQGLRDALFQCIDSSIEENAGMTFFNESKQGSGQHPFDLTAPTQLLQEPQLGDAHWSKGRSNAAKVLYDLNYEPDRPELQKEFRHNIGLFRNLMIYSSEGNLDGIGPSSMNHLRDRAVEIGNIAAYFQFEQPAHPRRARTAWNRSLNYLVDGMIGNAQEDMEVDMGKATIVDQSFGVFMGKLDEFASSVHLSGPAEKSDLARAYFKFLLEKISSRIQDERLRAEMYGILERERRPLADYLELQNELAKAKKLPTVVEKGFFSSFQDMNCIVSVPMFNEEYTRAYCRVLSKRVSDDMFRIMSVRLLEPLIFECIQFSLNLFNSNSTVIREAKLASGEADELEELRRVLQTHLDSSADPRNKKGN